MQSWGEEGLGATVVTFLAVTKCPTRRNACPVLWGIMTTGARGRAAGDTASTAMTQNRQEVRLDCNTSSPAPVTHFLQRDSTTQ